MKKIFFAAASIFLLVNVISCATKTTSDKKITSDTAHNSENSLDWAGVYTGELPGADSAIKTEITLKGDGTYTATTQYTDKSEDVFIDEGTFTWDSEGGTITLNSANNAEFPCYYKVGENQLIQLDMEGKVIESELADAYVLKKQP